MKSEYKVFGLLWIFLWVLAAIYAWWSNQYLSAEPGIATRHVDWVGTVALILSGLLLLMCATYFWFISRRIDPRPEDRPDGEIADAAGEVGFFSPGSYWPFGLALSAAVMGLGLVFWQPWLIIAGGVAILAATGGLIFEYYTGTRQAH